jgi:hypothetical protein
MWIVQLLFFLGVMYLVMRPEFIVIILVNGLNLGYVVYWRTKKAYQWMKRYYLLKTRTFEDRPVMAPPSIKPVLKKKF